MPRSASPGPSIFPSISLTGLFGWESTKLSQLFTGPARMWTWAAPVTQPIFTGGAIAGEVKAAEAFRDEALFQYQKAIQNAFRDVEDALVDQRRTREQLEAQARQVEALRTYAGTGTAPLRQRLYELHRGARRRAEPV